MNFDRGGQEVIKRLLIAYGFKTRKALCEQLGASTSTMSTRWMRDIFPADWVIQCAMETGASLKWLSFGEGETFDKGVKKTPDEYPPTANDNALNDVLAVPRKKIIDGNLYDSNFYMLDKAMLPSHLSKPVIIVDEDIPYIADQKNDEVSDGTWVVEIEGKVSVKVLTRIPVGKVLVAPASGGQSFECGINDLKPFAKCHYYLMSNV